MLQRNLDTGDKFVMINCVRSFVKLLHLGVKWVEGDICEASIQFFNPLPFDIEVANLVRSFASAI